MNNYNQTREDKPAILVVDDNAENLRLLSQMLMQQGYKVRVANSGQRALQSVRSSPPDLVLLDIMVPDMDGYTICEQLKADASVQDIPILFISALGETLDKVKAFSVGGVDYITKPFQVAEVLARVRTHLALRDLQKNLEQQVAELDAFAHTVAHDLKNPLSMLVGYANILAQELDDAQEEALRRYAQIIVKAARKMTNIVDELILLASVRQMDQVPPEALDMATIVEEARERLATLIAEHQAQVVIPPEWPTAWGYGPWIEEVWTNLISNGIKYGGRPDEGLLPRVELGADTLPPSADGRPFARFWVRDNGPGLTPEEQARLFTEFKRLHQVQTKGHGLGLSIVRRIVERLGGQVGVESTPGDGSLFYFTLPHTS